MIYEIPTKHEGDNIRMRLVEAKYIGRLADEALAAKWSAEASVARDEHDRLRREVKDAGEDPLVHALLPATKAYQKAVGRERQRVLARVVEIIVGGKGL